MFFFFCFFFALQMFKNALKNKDKLLDEITLKAGELQDEDGEKPNGTKDVDSRFKHTRIFRTLVYSKCSLSFSFSIMIILLQCTHLSLFDTYTCTCMVSKIRRKVKLCNCLARRTIINCKCYCQLSTKE